MPSSSPRTCKTTAIFSLNYSKNWLMICYYKSLSNWQQSTSLTRWSLDRPMRVKINLAREIGIQIAHVSRILCTKSCRMSTRLSRGHLKISKRCLQKSANIQEKALSISYWYQTKIAWNCRLTKSWLYTWLTSQSYASSANRLKLSTIRRRSMP
jgi:hypothetical protein